MRGAVVITESMLAAGSIIIGIILLVLVFNILFGSQAANVEDTSLIAVARSLEITIDRISASASSALTTYRFPEGVALNVTIEPKAIEINFANETRSTRRSLTGSLNIQHAYFFKDPDVLCIVKNRNDGRIYITDQKCECNILDRKCDPACAVSANCDPRCYKSTPDDVCDVRCVVQKDAICDPDCYRNQSDLTVDIDCIKSDDGICDPDTHGIEDGICDSDCRKNGIDGVCDPDCSVQGEDGVCDQDCNPDSTCNDVCDLDCGKANGICDPDCGSDPDCNTCAKEGESCADRPCCFKTLCGKEEYLTCTPGSKKCIRNEADACNDGFCDVNPWVDVPPSNGIKYAQWPEKSRPRVWENFYTCEGDCNGFDKKLQIPDKSGANCAARVSPGTFTSSVCITGTTFNDPGRQAWRDGVIDICSGAAIQYLNKRGWDINEVAKDITAQTPNGFAFDNSRYTDIPCSVQRAQDTINANEEYFEDNFCCCSTQDCALAPPSWGVVSSDVCRFTPSCGDPGAGVGFCIDHATAMLSVLRTLGVPRENVYIYFIVGLPPNCNRHGVVAYKCDQSLAGNLVLDGCVNGQWYVLDATSHSIELLSQTSCSQLCTWWNDNGLYSNQFGIDRPAGAQCANYNPANYEACKNDQNVYCEPENRK